MYSYARVCTVIHACVWTDTFITHRSWEGEMRVCSQSGFSRLTCNTGCVLVRLSPRKQISLRLWFNWKLTPSSKNFFFMPNFIWRKSTYIKTFSSPLRLRSVELIGKRSNGPWCNNHHLQFHWNSWWVSNRWTCIVSH